MAGDVTAVVVSAAGLAVVAAMVVTGMAGDMVVAAAVATEGTVAVEHPEV